MVAHKELLMRSKKMGEFWNIVNTPSLASGVQKLKLYKTQHLVIQSMTWLWTRNADRIGQRRGLGMQQCHFILSWSLLKLAITWWQFIDVARNNSGACGWLSLPGQQERFQESRLVGNCLDGLLWRDWAKNILYPQGVTFNLCTS